MLKQYITDLAIEQGLEDVDTWEMWEVIWTFSIFQSYAKSEPRTRNLRIVLSNYEMLSVTLPDCSMLKQLRPSDHRQLTQGTYIVTGQFFTSDYLISVLIFGNRFSMFSESGNQGAMKLVQTCAMKDVIALFKMLVMLLKKNLQNECRKDGIGKLVATSLNLIEWKSRPCMMSKLSKMFPNLRQSETLKRVRMVCSIKELLSQSSRPIASARTAWCGLRSTACWMDCRFYLCNKLRFQSANQERYEKSEI